MTGRDERDDGARDREEARGRSERGRVSVWEWAVAALGFLVVAGTIGFMLYRAVAGGHAPPRIVLRVESVVPLGEGFLVTVTAANEGDEPVADLAIEGRLAGAEGMNETSTATFSYVPGGSQAEGGLYFSADPRVGQLVLRPLGYERP